MPPIAQFKLNARCLGRALTRGQWRKLPHFLRGLVRALVVPNQDTGIRSPRLRRAPAPTMTAAIRAG